MHRIIDTARPRFVLAENVAGIVNMALDGVLTDLEAIGYTAGAVVIPAGAVNALHRRDRVWIMGYSDREQQPQLQRLQPDQWRRTGNAGITHGIQRDETPRALGFSPDGLSPELVRRSWADGTWEVDLPRVVTHESERKQKLQAAGNAIVPQVAYEILKVMIGEAG